MILQENEHCMIVLFFVVAVKKNNAWVKWTYTQYLSDTKKAAKSFIKVTPSEYCEKIFLSCHCLHEETISSVMPWMHLHGLPILDIAQI